MVYNFGFSMIVVNTEMGSSVHVRPETLYCGIFFYLVNNDLVTGHM